MLVEFIYKSGELDIAPTSIDEESSSQGDVKLGIRGPSNEEQVEYPHNPLQNVENSAERHPLLRRMNDAEHKTEIMQKEMKAKTGRLKEEMRKLGKSVEEKKTLLEGMAESL